MKQGIVLGMGCALALSACSDDTGILVEVHGSEVQADIARLDTMVIIDDGSAAQPDGLAWGAAERIRADVGVDLHVDPYTVMLRPDGVADDTGVWVSALAYDANNTLVGWGEISGMVAFRKDLVKTIELDLHEAQVTGDGCVVKNGNVVVRTGNDCDADQVTYDVDCNDLDAQVGGDLDGDPVVCSGDCDQTNPNIYPGNAETCDGIDDDCDPSSLPPPQLCVMVGRDDTGAITECGVGEQICNDSHTGGQLGTCLVAPIDTTTNNGLCQYWGGCLDAGGDVQSCLVDGRMHCKLESSSAGVPCLAAITPMKLEDYFGISSGNGCTWRLIGNIQQGAWNLGLRQQGSTGTIASFYDGCDAELVVEAAPVTPHVIVLEADLGGGQFLDYAVVIDPRRTGCDANQGSDLECTVAP